MSQIALTELAIRALKGSDKSVTHWDSLPGFGVRVGKRAKTYVVVRGRNRERISIGKFGDISLAEARNEARRLLSTKPEPIAPGMTFKAAREAFLDTYENPRTRYNVTKLLTLYFKPLEQQQLADIDDADVKKCLDKLADRPSQQLHAYRSVRAFLKWCTRAPRRYMKLSPMEGYEPPGKDRKGTRTLTDEELVAIWNASETAPYSIFRLLILFGTRNMETTLLERNWVVEGVLTIPGGHTKNGRDHGIPIEPLAQTVLDGLPANERYFFPSRWGDAHLTHHALPKLKAEVMKRSKTKNWQIRDIRRTFRSNMARLKVPREVCEVLINHAPPVLDEIYDRYDRIEEKRAALAKYEAFLQGLLAQG